MNLDPTRILSDLGFSQAPASVAPVSGGWDTSIFRVELEGHSYALRVFRLEQARVCQREAAVMRALSEQGLPVASVRAEGAGQGRPVLLLDWCPGRPLFEEIKYRPWRIWKLGQRMGGIHARIHAAFVADSVAAALPRVEVQTDLTAQNRILHLDYHPLNVMSDGERITAVLDWANAAVGDLRADLARTVTLLRLAPMPPGLPLPVAQALRLVLEAAWRRGYREAHAADPFADMDPFYVWAGEWMEQDLRPKLGRPGVWLRETDLLRIRQWTTARKKRAAALHM